MANKRAEALASNLDNTNVLTFLDLISAAEGTVKNGYRTAFGGSEIPSLTDHPRVSHSFTQTDGKKNKTTAAGRYQFLTKTWDDVAKRLDLKDFGERSQDLGALELIRRAGALDDIKNGDFATALKKTGKTWASLPSSPYPQPKRSAEWVEQFLAAKNMESRQEAADVEAVTQLASAEATDEAAAALGDLPVQMVANANTGMASAAPTGEVFNTLGRPAWAEQLPQVASLQSVSDAEAAEPWEEQLMMQAFANEGDAARSDAVASFFGEAPTPTVQLPRTLERTINRLIASL